MEWHLKELEGALRSRGWDIVRELPGDDYRISGTWEIERRGERLFLDFVGLDDLECLPLERAYGCDVRGTNVDLYFGKRPTQARPNSAWRADLASFVSALDASEHAASEQKPDD